MTGSMVFLLDMDGTIIGDSVTQLCRYELFNNLGIKNDYSFMQEDIENGLLRPYFESFMKLMSIKYPNAEFFIYTAAEKKWASSMIGYIEKYIKIKFNRPIFSREYCVIENNNLKKSISKVLPIIYKKLKNKHQLQSIDQLSNNIILIDNNYVIKSSDQYRFIKCPSYEYFVPCNILSGISQRKLKQNIALIVAILGKYRILNSNQISTSIDVAKLYSIYYNSLAELYKASASSTNRTKKDTDTFWLHLERVFRNHEIKSLNKKVVSYMNKSI
jgi:hypothetical protein